MNFKLLVIKSKKKSEEMQKHIDYALSNVDYEIYEEGIDCTNRKIIFIIELNELGYDLELLKWLSKKAKQKNFFENSVGGIIIKSSSELYTKTFAQDVILHSNFLGLSFIGHSVIEITRNYENFITWKKTIDKSLSEIASINCKNLVDKICNFKKKNFKKKILALHSSSYKTSNTLGLWSLVKKELIKNGEMDIDEIHIENGAVFDCKGCSFQTCLNYGKQKSCFYGGIMVKEILPKIEEADIIVWVCPNYNDSISANMLSVINRLTVLYRQISFSNKSFFSIIVSGNSGSDALAKQLIGALNINKGFYLPPYFALMETANDPLKVLELEDVDFKTKEFAYKIINENC